MLLLTNTTSIWLKNMAARFAALLDVNVILDVLARREPHYEDSALVWAAVETGQIDGYIAAHSITTLHYLVSWHMGGEQATRAIHKLLRVFSVATVGQATIEQALALNWPDFEDAVQMAAALHTGVDYLITRNPRDFKPDGLQILQPGDALALLHAEAS